jgi:hypothetical protein
MSVVVYTACFAITLGIALWSRYDARQIRESARQTTRRMIGEWMLLFSSGGWMGLALTEMFGK